ncbi:putative retroelement [Phytophthora cinnamomi]|uniref:putative retroelement n=1 Tax=Phytophthora cinnamomi TaxID=4785 RepID=UPI00355ABAEA|nr:putative retroelement [Phytophthora cinnamomi]
MGHGKALSEQEHWFIVGLHDGGVSLHEIARKTGRSPVTGEFFAAEIKTKLGIKASVRTIQRVLQRVDHLVYTKMDRTLPLATAHKAARVQWAEAYILKPDTWIHTIFSDEKKFNLDGPDGFKYFWRDMRQPEQSYLRRQNGGGSVMVWGAFSAADCNPMENVWSAMAAKVYAHGRQYHNFADLEAAIMAAWDAIQLDYLLKLVESMPRRCLAVIKKKGGLTKY